MRRIKKMYVLAIIIIALITVAFVVFASDVDNENVRFLAQFGWRIDEECFDSTDIIIPDPFDRVYENYNKIQLQSGFDLRPYKGMKGKRYTYKVLNYPVKVNEDVYANVIWIDSVPIGGDICTFSLDGFMHGLKDVLH